MARLKLALNLLLVLGTLFPIVANWRSDFDPNHQLVIDEKNYLFGAFRMKEKGTPFYTEDGLHSVGMQMLTYALLLATDTGHVRTADYYLNLVLWTLLIALAGGIGFLFSRDLTFALATAFFTAHSALLRKYCGYLQYEIPAAFLTAVLLFLCLRPLTRRMAYAAGALIALLGIFRFHFTQFLPLVALVHAGSLKREGAVWRPVLIALLLGFVAIALPFNLYYSVKRGQPFFFQTNVTTGTFLNALNPKTDGRAFPYQHFSADKGVRGLPFIAQMPGKYLDLLSSRFGFLVGLEKDAWFIESDWVKSIADKLNGRSESIRPWFVLFLILSIVGGTAVCLRNAAAFRFRHPSLLILAPPLVVLLPNFLVNSSTRFLVTAIPFFIVLQLAFWNELVKRVRPLFADGEAA